MICDFCEHEMQEYDRHEEMVYPANETTPAEYKIIWVLWRCQNCGDYQYEFI